MRLDSPVSETAAPVAPHPPIERRSYRWVALPLLAFALFSLTAGLLAAHDPRSKGYFRLFFEDPIHLKAGFASAAVALGVLPGLLGHLDLRQAAVAQARVDQSGASVVRPARVRLHAARCLPLHLQARLPPARHPRPPALALRLRVLRRVRREDHDRAAAPVPGAGAADRRRDSVLRPDRCLVHERGLALHARHAFGGARGRRCHSGRCARRRLGRACSRVPAARRATR